MHPLAGAALLLAAAGTLLPPPAAAQQLPAGPLKLPGPSSAAIATAAAAAEQGQLFSFEPAQPASPGDETLGVAGGRRSVQAAAAMPGEPPHLPAGRLSRQRSQTANSVRPLSRRLDETSTRQQVAGPLTLPGPGQRFSGTAQLTNQLVTAGASPAAEGSKGAGGQEGGVQGSNTRRLLAAVPLQEALLQPPEAVAAPPAAEQPSSLFAAILPTAAAPAAEAATAAQQPPAAETLGAAAPEEQTPFEPMFPAVPPTELSVAPAAEGLPAEAVPEPVTAAVPGPGSEDALLEQAELALSGPTGTAIAPAFPPAAGSTGVSAGTEGTEAQLETGQPLAGTPGSNFSSLISLLDPPAAFQMPPLSPQQQENLPKLQQLRQGIGTVSVWRDVGNFGGTQMACGMGFLSDYFKDHFVALPTVLYRSGELCGACVRIWCVDSVCTDALVRNASFMVTDSCKDCTGNNILVSERGFANLTGINVNISPKLQIAWAFESCAPLIQGGIRILASKNNGATFLSYNFSNLRQLLRSVTIGGIPFTRTAYGTWELNSPGRNIAIPQTGAEIVLTSVDGQRISKRLRSLGSQDLGTNFA